MNINCWLSRSTVAVTAMLAITASATAVVDAAETTAASQSANGIPDFSSNRVMWVLAGGYQKVPGDTGAGPITGTNKYRPKIIDPVAATDNPLLLPWAKKIMDDENQKVIAGQLGFNPASRCYPGGVPGVLLFPGEPMQIVQTPKVVYMMWKRDAQIRRIFLNVPHSKDREYSWYGESVGHYEGGDTLVVDTIALDDKGPLDRFRTPHTRQLHVVERLKLTRGGKGYDVFVRVEDPGTFTAPWSAKVSFEQGYEYRNDHWEEDICAEAGDGLIPVPGLRPMPQASRRDF